MVDLNFRMDSSALYSDIIMPSAFWYEKNDLNTTDLHSYVHPLGQAVPPVWESKTDWEIFKLLARKVSEMAPEVFPQPVRDIVAYPLMHDTPDESAIRCARLVPAGECEAIPGKTMPHFSIVERDYANLYHRFISWAQRAPAVWRQRQRRADPHRTLLRRFAGAAHRWASARRAPYACCVEWGGKKYPSLEDTLDTANVLLYLAPETNGEVSYQAFKHEEERVGLPLADLAEGVRGINMTFHDLTRQVRRTLISPCWTGMVNDGRAYAAWCMNVERLVPWRTLTGRQHFYVDHPYYLDFGEHLPTFKPKLNPRAMVMWSTARWTTRAWC